MSDNRKVFEKLGVPKNIIIKEYTYTFKKELKNDIISYRCIHRKCPSLISISKSEIKKLIDNNENNNIKITYTNIHNLDLHKSIITKNESKDDI